ncbi:MAG: alpha/beta hydrolase [bacterium]|nr:alpha/beta hydrolase [bacterium]
MSTQIILVPGFWLGAWAWDEVASRLRERGFDVTALTLPGLEEGGSGQSGATLQDHADAIGQALDEGADRRILVAHSGAAFPATWVVDCSPELVDRLVLVDTAPPVDGLAFNAEAAEDFTLEQAWAELEEEGSFGGLSEAHLEEFRRRAVPQPRDVVATPIRLQNEARKSVPVTAICTLFDSKGYQQYAEQGVPFVAGLLEYEVDYVDLPTGHWPMWSKPAELADLIAEAAGK